MSTDRKNYYCMFLDLHQSVAHVIHMCCLACPGRFCEERTKHYSVLVWYIASNSKTVQYLVPLRVPHNNVKPVLLLPPPCFMVNNCLQGVNQLEGRLHVTRPLPFQSLKLGAACGLILTFLAGET